MKLTIERSALLKSLGHVQSVVEKRNTIPILSNVRLDASEDEKMHLTATDMDLAVIEAAPANVTQPGATTTSAHMLYDIVRKLAEGSQIEITLIEDSGKLEIRSGRSRFTLACLPVEDFPVMAEGELAHRFSIDTGHLRRLIDKTGFAVSTEETRYYLNGIYVHATDENGEKSLRAVATDGHRLARVDTDLPEGAENIPGVIIPRKTVAELRKLIEESDGEIMVALSDSKIRFALDGAILTSKLIDGSFPDYERVIPSSNEKILTVDNHVFTQAVDRVSTISTEKSRAIKMTLKGSQMTLSANSPDAGAASEEIEAQHNLDSIEIGFNSRYVLDMAKQIGGDTIEFRLADSSSPTLVRDSEDENAVYVIMPMRV
ncbi:MAG: DNA polymerase III subunit beta [Rhodospirillaceae bacterium]|nr:DNA polymerase III subunit beta [Rhodospirillaceae bacterium]